MTANTSAAMRAASALMRSVSSAFSGLASGRLLGFLARARGRPGSLPGSPWPSCPAPACCGSVWLTEANTAAAMAAPSACSTNNWIQPMHAVRPLCLLIIPLAQSATHFGILSTTAFDPAIWTEAAFRSCWGLNKKPVCQCWRVRRRVHAVPLDEGRPQRPGMMLLA